jgi:hypothetical protein
MVEREELEEVMEAHGFDSIDRVTLDDSDDILGVDSSPVVATHRSYSDEIYQVLKEENYEIIKRVMDKKGRIVFEVR